MPAAPTPWSLLKLFKLANHKLAYPASQFASYGNHDKDSHPHFPVTFCLLTELGASPCSPAWCGTPPSLGTMGNKLSFQWQSSDLLASPYLNNNKIYILKHLEEWDFPDGPVINSNAGDVVSIPGQGTKIPLRGQLSSRVSTRERKPACCN